MAAGSLALLALGWGLGRQAVTAEHSTIDMVAQERVARLEEDYRSAVRRIEALESTRGEAARLEATFAEFTRALRENRDRLHAADGSHGRETRGPDGTGLWTQLLDFGLDATSLWNLLHARGDLEALAALVDDVDAWGTDRLARPDLPDEETARVEAMLHQNRFRKGYIQFALGDIEAAAAAFRAQIAAVDELEATLIAREEELEPVTAIYRERSKRILEVMETVARRPPPADFALGEAWVTERRARLADLTGKAVALFFRRAGDARSAGLMGRLSRHCAADPDMETVTLCYLRAGDELDAQRGKLLEELRSVEYQGIAGFDPDGDGQSLFRSFKVAVGSATLCILDGHGQVVWIMEDPRTQDFAFARRILERMVGE